MLFSSLKPTQKDRTYAKASDIQLIVLLAEKLTAEVPDRGVRQATLHVQCVIV